MRISAIVAAVFFALAGAGMARADVKMPQWEPTAPSPEVAFQFSSMDENIHIGKLRARIPASASR